MPKTLYVTDLDGTLLQNDQTLSVETVRILNELLDQGLCFTYATGRSLQSAAPITKPLHLTLPVITRDGCIAADPKTNREIEINRISDEMIRQLRPILSPIMSSCFTTTYSKGSELKLYFKGEPSEGFKQYLEEHAEDKKLSAAPNEDALYENEISFFKFIASCEELEPVYLQVKDDPELSCFLQKDNYSDAYWFSIYPKCATKAAAIQKLQKQLGCDRLVVFGDSVNDISMCQIADESCAVANATEELKKAATTIIGSNMENSVARWIQSDQIG